MKACKYSKKWQLKLQERISWQTS
uniref:Uncharacterized protein n=1 Tax=Rhizophora mucronata TaxID=61149 RepID=A0A2P2QYM4_RHIMU